MQQFEIHLNARQGIPENYRMYDWLSTECELIGEYARAMRYIERYIQSTNHDEETLATLQRRHERYKRLRERQLIDRTDAEVGN